MSKVLSYRPDIDTLRAVAVLSVVVFHIEKNWLPGGFLGVDIFFVISGFWSRWLSIVKWAVGFFRSKNFTSAVSSGYCPHFYRIDGNADMRLSFIHQRWFFPFMEDSPVHLGVHLQYLFCKGSGLFRPHTRRKTFASHLVFIGRRTILFRLPDIAVTGSPQKLAHPVCLPHHTMRIQHFGFFYADCAG